MSREKKHDNDEGNADKSTNHNDNYEKRTPFKVATNDLREGIKRAPKQH